MMQDLYKSGPVGNVGVGGSLEAADLIAPKVEHQRAAVARVISEAGTYGATGDEIADRLGWLVYAVRPRTSDLRKAGLIFDSQRRRTNPNGISCVVWISKKHAKPVQIGEAA